MSLSESKYFRIFGPPGTGKTTRLLNEIDDLIMQGVQPNKIGFFAFTRKAANEAKDRAITRFGLDHEDLVHFRTLQTSILVGIKKTLTRWKIFPPLCLMLRQCLV